jgi:phage replication-related protein YjqB (UPF0714/DUF867 family)
MADKYPDFATLSRNETSGIDYRILVRRAGTNHSILAIHGGGIEPGTSEIADAIAAQEFSFYAFDGLKARDNSDLHITSTHFDEPMCLILAAESGTVITIHGEGAEADAVFVGGRDTVLGDSLGAALTARGFDVRRHPQRRLQGLEPENVCNRGKSGKGVQFELSRGVRESMFKSLSREGRKCPTARFRAFVEAIRGVLAASARTAAAG